MANVTFTSGTFPLGYCYPGPEGFKNDLVALLVGTINITGKVLVGPNAPAPTDRDGVWVRTVGNYLEGIYLYQGGWFRPHPVAPGSSVRQIWRGTEVDLWSYEGGDGTDPLTTPPTPTNGAMWQRDLDFGSDDGTSCFRIPVGVGINPTAYDGNPATVIALGTKSGEEKIALTIDQIPSHTHIVHQGHVEHGAQDTNVLQGITSDGAPDTVTGDINTGTNPNNSHDNMPPYVGVFYIKRTIRAMIQAV